VDKNFSPLLAVPVPSFKSKRASTSQVLEGPAKLGGALLTTSTVAAAKVKAAA
jgi:hypothetical protein